ncbi:hypothetical protein [Glutamicibacter nicotianae]|uniref:hypothetical protein n=1 Tax=Glutamicibacter nicotianae TaxID=37929 RepID=UPI0013CE435B|nr:hypothetical protein [Glutamicibacter nicotianae]
MTDATLWTPPGMGDEDKISFLAFREGIPNAANELIRVWLLQALPANRSYSRPEYAQAAFLKFQSAMGQDFGFRRGNFDYYYDEEVIILLSRLDQTNLAYFIDYVLAHTKLSEFLYKHLESILLEARSSWKVGTQGDSRRLMVRVPAAVSEIVESITDKSGAASTLLRKAWNKAFGTDAEPGAAYSAAVKSVEVYTGEIFCPSNRIATLGTAIRDFQAKPSKWAFTLGSADSSNLDQLLGMMKLLWHNQNDRHGSTNYQDVSTEEAQAAVLLATTLVGWFDNGLVYRVEE